MFNCAALFSHKASFFSRILVGDLDAPEFTVSSNVDFQEQLNDRSDVIRRVYEILYASIERKIMDNILFLCQNVNPKALFQEYLSGSPNQRHAPVLCSPEIKESYKGRGVFIEDDYLGEKQQFGEMCIGISNMKFCIVKINTVSKNNKVTCDLTYKFSMGETKVYTTKGLE